MKKLLIEDAFKKHSNSIYRFCYVYLSNKEEAEDITSFTFQKLLSQNNPESIEDMKAWLFTVARNSMFTKLKRDNKFISKKDIESIEVTDDRLDLEEIVVTELLREKLKNHLMTLDPTISEVIMLKVWEELQFNEIAEITNQGLSKVKKKFYRGIEELKSLISIDEKLKLRAISIPSLLYAISFIKNDAEFTFTGSLPSIGQSTGSLNSIPKANWVIGAAGVAMAAAIFTGIAANPNIINNSLSNNNDQISQVEHPNKDSEDSSEDCNTMQFANEEITFVYDDCTFNVETEKKYNQFLSPITRSEVQGEIFNIKITDLDSSKYLIISIADGPLASGVLSCNSNSFGVKAASPENFFMIRSYNANSFTTIPQFIIDAGFNENEYFMYNSAYKKDNEYCTYGSGPVINIYNSSNKLEKMKFITVITNATENDVNKFDELVGSFVLNKTTEIEKADNNANSIKNCELATFEENTITKFSFQYDPCVFEVTNDFSEKKYYDFVTGSELIGNKNIVQIRLLSDKSNVLAVVIEDAQGDGGPFSCKVGETAVKINGVVDMFDDHPREYEQAYLVHYVLDDPSLFPYFFKDVLVTRSEILSYHTAISRLDTGVESPLLGAEDSLLYGDYCSRYSGISNWFYEEGAYSSSVYFNIYLDANKDKVQIFESMMTSFNFGYPLIF